MQEHKYQAREKPVREIEREEKTKIRQEGKGLARDRPIEKVLLEKHIKDKETVPAEKEKMESLPENLLPFQSRRRKWKERMERKNYQNILSAWEIFGEKQRTNL